ncbi:competence type IV pilus minor pilin ComGD [Bacillus sp. FJAT-49736]|uniref:competence type IV pilus minor pilin ComGD n=1 Tax=Bacillus sp. FJAT-49736 TaxID=2833582 RepID=UPI001BC92C66|nr:competence type IV pilus minor pilin ComGD [Bacillus sp. FJAT-49736]MBS4173453.1 prepilin-type N-terminal cleavage/methylation domain-containing protein [Bacillus sp. FJAT-49736]
MKANFGNKGFTMVEVLIVLLLFTIFLSFSMAIFKPLKNAMEKKLIISQLEADLYYAQTYAVNRQEPVSVQFYPMDNRYVMKAGKGKVIVNRLWTSSVTLMNGGTFNSFTILPDGNISKFGKLSFQINGRTFSLIFNIGRGRFRVQE